jgi:outer membrane protein TolC
MNISQAFAQAVRSRPELRAVHQRLKVAQSNIDGAKSAYGPKIRAEGGYGWRDKEFLPHEEEWLIGVTLDLPLFTGFSRKHRLARAKAEMSKEEAEMERVIQKIRQEVWSAYSKLKETYEATQSAEILVKDALESHRLAQERYKVGAGTLTDLLDAQTALDRAEAHRVAAHWDYHIARSILSRATGNPADDSIAKNSPQ